MGRVVSTLFVVGIHELISTFIANYQSTIRARCFLWIASIIGIILGWEKVLVRKIKLHQLLPFHSQRRDDLTLFSKAFDAILRNEH